MFKKILSILVIFVVFILVSIYYNYKSAQKAISETKASVLTTDLVTYPESIVSGKTGYFVWMVNTPNDLIATNTTIYWGYESTPSAVTVNDPPSSLGYPSMTSDYLHGQFKLPDDFDSQITFDQPGTVYFRSYAKVGDQNLWSKEYSLNVLAK